MGNLQQTELYHQSVMPGSFRSPIKVLSATLASKEMDLIEVLWKQDVDLGFTLTNAALSTTPEGTGTSTSDKTSATNIKCDSDDDLEKLKALLEIKNDKNVDSEKHRESTDDSSLVDPWAGLSYTIDTETGE
uniref:Uncharacterized protein n=1 Tax=Anopheles farauti TaxID=69004 RepID=A0A182QFT8_9DIPT